MSRYNMERFDAWLFFFVLLGFLCLIGGGIRQCSCEPAVGYKTKGLDAVVSIPTNSPSQSLETVQPEAGLDMAFVIDLSPVDAGVDSWVDPDASVTQ